jgi:hypothetical protein
VGFGVTTAWLLNCAFDLYVRLERW